MEVIKKGPEWSMDVECTGYGNGNDGCGALLRVTLDDVFKNQVHAGNETNTYLTIRCCECSVMTDLARNHIPSDDIPIRIWNNAATGVRHKDGGLCHPNELNLTSGPPKSPMWETS